MFFFSRACVRPRSRAAHRTRMRDGDAGTAPVRSPPGDRLISSTPRRSRMHYQTRLRQYIHTCIILQRRPLRLIRGVIGMLLTCNTYIHTHISFIDYLDACVHACMHMTNLVGQGENHELEPALHEQHPGVQGLHAAATARTLGQLEVHLRCIERHYLLTYSQSSRRAAITAMRSGGDGRKHWWLPAHLRARRTLPALAGKSKSIHKSSSTHTCGPFDKNKSSNRCISDLSKSKPTNSSSAANSEDKISDGPS